MIRRKIKAGLKASITVNGDIYLRPGYSQYSDGLLGFGDQWSVISIQYPIIGGRWSVISD